MSGGLWNYVDNHLADEIFGWDMDCRYGERGHKECSKARRKNPMEDREVSEMLWDMLCLLNSRDYYGSGDIGKDAYKEDLKWFKDKWLHRTEEAVLEAYKQDLREYAAELIQEIK